MQLSQRMDAQWPSAASKHSLELVLSDLSDLHQAAGDVDRALALMSSALEYGEQAQRMDPVNRLYARSQARTRGEVAHLSFDLESPALRDLDRSMAAWEPTVREWETYAQADPQDKLGQLTLAINLTESAITTMQRSPLEAEAPARRGVAIFDGLRANSPKFDQSWGTVWARARTRLAWILIRTGKTAEARRLTDAALPVLRERYQAGAETAGGSRDGLGAAGLVAGLGGDGRDRARGRGLSRSRPRDCAGLGQAAAGCELLELHGARSRRGNRSAPAGGRPRQNAGDRRATGHSLG
jgi:hypothetical protein